MNKLIVNKENNIVIKDNAIELQINVKDLTIKVEGKVLINEINTNENEINNIIINLEPNSKLIYNRFLINNKMNTTIVLNQQHNSTLNFNFSLISKDNSNLEVFSNIKGDNNNTSINIKAITEDKGNIKISATADCQKEIKNNDLIEDIRVLNLNNQNSIIIPNLLVSSNEVTVNHAATISSIDDNYLFYLNSKGIDNKKAIKLIKRGYLTSILETDSKLLEQIKNLI